MMKEESWVRRYPLVLFFVLAYAFSWGNYFLARAFPGVPFLFPFGPLVAALIAASVTGGVSGLKDLASRCVRWRVGLKWYAAALIVPTLIGLAAIALSVLLGGPSPATARLGPWYNLFLLFPLALWDAPFGEETGWRGFALPRFSARRSPLLNSLILGVLIMGWHLPLVLGEPAMIAPYVLGGLASAILTNWIYYNTRGSALLAMLYHSAANTVGLYFAPMLAGPDQVRYFWLLAAVNWAAAGAVILLAGSTLRRGPVSPEAVHVSIAPPATAHEVP